MAITDKVRRWYEREYGIPLSEAADLDHELQNYNPEQEISRRDIDKENSDLFDKLCMKTVPPLR